MDDGIDGSSVSPPGPKKTYKVGWLKKSSGLLGLWKDRYIQILRTQLLICDHEDDQKCLETLELANYERCQDQKAFLKRKRHFTLIPSPGTKVQDVKFQAKNAEERDAWIQALNDGINRGKNKVLDEVKIDTSCSLEHVTRDRVKVGATKRRPPTRIHLKEVAEAATDDSLRLGLEALDTGILTVVPPMPKPKDTEPEPQKEPVKIPMPPRKQNPTQALETTVSDTTDSEVQAPLAPLPPAKSLKGNVYAREKLLSENEQTSMEENSTLKVLPNESTENLNEVASSPPKPPPKILSDKMKIKWVGSSSDSEEKEDIISEERGSKENLVDFESDELETPSISYQAESLEDLQTKELRSSLNSSQEESWRLSQHLNDVDTDEGALQETPAESICKSNEHEEKHEIEKNDTLTSDVQEQHTKQPTDEKKVRYVKHQKKTGHVTTQTHHIKSKLKASSMGDLLSPINETGKDSTMVHLTKDHFNQVEMNLACGKERTKTLLNQILMGKLGKTAEGNGVECNPEIILNDLMAQLQEASEVLQEMKEKEPRNVSNTSDVVTEQQKEKQRELMALQRRSVPF
ncbi:PREDICTED: pleckstrin homology domain-containing family O member 2 [Nanorana parkeri]|uniref:pleckstrin homology domain-containing family O member 2 n=1 Tax=Nanorana parkeri TaxID=125878 RepID=UPI000854A50A|nr:PREDICTED: pleckstrin homology domain-containing family O member 2 [Nanorana parkeri]